jgi:ABC-type multidrug transport system ATPase subunit
MSMQTKSKCGGDESDENRSRSCSTVRGRRLFCSQYSALMHLHFILSSRSPLSLLVQISLGFVLCVLLFAFQILANLMLGGPVTNPPTNLVPILPRCVSGPTSVRPGNIIDMTIPGCTTLMFAPDTTLVRRLMTGVANATGLTMDVDIIPVPNASKPPWELTWVNSSLFNANLSMTCAISVGDCADPIFWLTGECMPCSFASDNRTLIRWHADHPNSTQNSIFVFGAYVDDSSYSMLYNLTLLSFPFFADSHLQSLKNAIDTALLTGFAANSGINFNNTFPLVDIQVRTKSFPRPKPTEALYDVFASNGGLWMYVAPAAAFFVLLNDLVYEKETFLRVSMVQAGLIVSAFWMSWATKAIIINTLLVLVLMASGYIFNFALFTYSSPIVTFVLFMSFSLSMSSLAALLSTMSKTSRGAQTTGFFFLLSGFVFEAITCSSYAGLLDLLYANELEDERFIQASLWIGPLRKALHAYPPFSFAYALASISNEASIAAHTNSRPVSWSDLWIEEERVFLGFKCCPPPPIHFIKVLLYCSIIFSALTVYFDAVLPGPQGTTSHILFFIGCKKRRSKTSLKAKPESIASDLPKDIDDTSAEPFLLMNPPTQSKNISYRLRTTTPVLTWEPEFFSQQMETSKGETDQAASTLNTLFEMGEESLHPRVKQMITSFPSIDDELETPLLTPERDGDITLRGSSLCDTLAMSTQEIAASALEEDSGVVLETQSTLNRENDENVLARVINLRVIYRNGWSAFFHSITGIEWQPLFWLGLPPLSRWTGILFVSTGSVMKTRRRIKRAMGGTVNTPTAARFESDTKRLTHARAKPTASDNSGAGDVVAVDDLTFSIKKNEVLVMLGHNGAGKTTTISVLTGLVQHTSGIVEIAGRELNGGAGETEGLIGVCTQNDCLWPSLSSRETLYLFAAIKGVLIDTKSNELKSTFVEEKISTDSMLSSVIASVSFFSSVFHPAEAIVKIINDSLDEVNLSAVQHRPTSTLSGGMRRRLSMAVASLGSPKLLFLDEPTTGMDPVNREGVWTLVRKLKLRSSVILTTHAMEEADALGDRIGIMGGGRLVAIGDPLALKLRYGDGYRLSLVLRDNARDSFECVKKEVLSRAPTAVVSLWDAANVVFTIPFDRNHQKNKQAEEVLPGLLDWCEHVSVSTKRNATNDPLLVEYAISGPTLEQAFLRVSSLVDFDLARSTEVGGNGDTPLSSLNGSDSNLDLDAAARNIARSNSSPRLSLSQSQVSFNFIDGAVHQAIQQGALEFEAAFDAGGLGSAPPQNRTITLTGRASTDTSPRGVLSSPCSIKSPTSIATDNPSSQGSPIQTRNYSPLSSKKRSNNSDAEHSATAATTSFGIYALIVKAATLVIRERTLFLCQVITPVLVLAILVALRAVIVAEVGGVAILSLPSVSLPLNAHLWQTVNNGNEITPRSTEQFIASYYMHSSLFSTHSILNSNNNRKNAATPENRNCVQFFLTGVDPAVIEPPQVHESPCKIQNDCGNSSKAVYVNASLLAEAVGYFGKITLLPGTYSNLSPMQIAASMNLSAGLLGSVPSTWCELRNETLVSAPYWDMRNPALSKGVFEIFDDEIMTDLIILSAAPRNSLSYDFQPPCNANGEVSPGVENPYNEELEMAYCPAFLVPDASVSFHDVASAFTIDPAVNDISSLRPDWLSRFRISYTLQMNDLSDSLLHRPNGLSQQDNFPEGVGFPLTSEQAKIEVMDLVFRGFSHWSGLSSIQVDTSTEKMHFDMPLVVLVSSFPEKIEIALSQLVDIIGSVLFPVTLTLLLPLFLFLAVLEKERGLVELQLAMGMHYLPYVTVNYVLNLVIFCTVASVFWFIASLLNFSFFTNTSPVLLATILFAWGLNVCSLTTTIAALITNRHVAVHIGFVLSLLIPLLSTAIAAGIYGLVAQSLGSGAMAVHMPSSLFLVPLFGPCLAFVRIIYLGNFHCLMQRRCIADLSTAMIMEDGEIRRAITALFFSAIFYQALGLYLDNVMPRAFGTRQHICFCVPRGVRRRAGKTFSNILLALSGSVQEQSSSSSSSSNISSPTSSESQQVNSSLFEHIQQWAKFSGLSIRKAVQSYARGEDEDVYKERMVVEYAARNNSQGTAQSELEREILGERFPVFLKGLRKEFPVNASLACPMPPTSSDITDSEDNNEGLMLGGPIDIHTQSNYIEIEQTVLLAHRVLRPEFILQGGAGTKVAVSDLSLAIEGGSCFGLLGENGCGKSTTLSIIMGLLPSTQGRAFVNGFDVEREPFGARQSLGVCPQMDCLWPTLTVGEHLLYYARLKGVQSNVQTDHVRKALAEVGLAHVQNRKISGLSGGMRRRVSLAIALVGHARVVLLDEPSTGLDPASKRRLWRLIENARRDKVDNDNNQLSEPDSCFRDRGRALVLVSHDLAEIETLCDRISIMTHGRLRCLQTGAALRQLYGNGYTLSVRFDLSISTLQDCISTITEHIPGTVVDAAYSSGYAIFSLPKSISETAIAGMSIARVFSAMLDLQHQSNGFVTEWSLSQSSLDVIFRKIVQHYQ